MTPLEEQVTQLLGLTNTLNVLDAIEHVKTLKHLLATTEQQRKEWAELSIKKQKRIDKLESIRTTPSHNTDTPALDFLIQYSGLQKSTIENSFQWVIKSMEAWENHLTKP
jgi:pantothenate kinase